MRQRMSLIQRFGEQFFGEIIQLRPVSTAVIGSNSSLEIASIEFYGNALRSLKATKVVQVPIVEQRARAVLKPDCSLEVSSREV